MCALQLMPGRIWKGQELVLEILVAVFLKCSGLLECSQTDDDNRVMVVVNVTQAENLAVPEAQKPSCVLYNSFVTKLADSYPENGKVDEDMDVANVDAEMELVSNEIEDAKLGSNLSQVHSFSISNIPSDQTETSYWRLYIDGCFKFLLHESTRGNRQYRLAVAKCLSSFPMELTTGLSPSHSTVIKSSSLFTRSLPFLLSLVDSKIGRYTSEPSLNSDVNKLLKTSGTSDLQQPNRTGNSLASKPSISRSNNALFGNRYGVDSKASNPRKRSFVSESKKVANVLIEKVQDISTRSDSLMLNSENKLSDNDFIIAFQSRTDIPQVVDPAFRVKIVECIAKGLEFAFQTQALVRFADSKELNISLTELHVPFLRWARDLFKSSDLWSMRRASILVLCSVIKSLNSQNYENASFFVDITLAMISTGVEDVKSFQVRIVSLECLSILLQVATQRDISIERISSIDSIFLNISHDKKPEVIEQASKTLKLWKLFQLTHVSA